MLCSRRDILNRSWDSASLKKITKNQKKNYNKKGKKQKQNETGTSLFGKRKIQFWGINKDYSGIINPGRIHIPE